SGSIASSEPVHPATTHDMEILPISRTSCGQIPFLLLGLAALGPAAPAAAQAGEGRVGGFAVSAFNEREQVARWLLAYDAVAWVTSDSAFAAGPDVQQRLGPEWFAWQQDSTWHAFFGRHEPSDDRYEVVLHFEHHPDGSVRRSTAAVDTTRLTRFARALHVSRPRMEARVPRGLRMNQYVRERADGHLEVWYLPAWQPSGFIVHGAQLAYRLDPAARAVVDSSIAFQPLRGARPDTSGIFSIHEAAEDVPSVGSIFLVLRYHPYFHRMYAH